MSHPVPAAPISSVEFQELLDRVERYLERIDDGVQRLLENCNRAVRWLPDFVADQLVPALRRLHELTARFFAELAKIVVNPGWPPALIFTAGDWTTRVGGPVNALAGVLTADRLRGDNTRLGNAADAYRDTLPAQKAAIEGIKQLTDVLDSNLTKVGWAIVAMWAGVAVAIGSFVAEILAASAAAATVAGAPPAAAAAGSSTAKAIGVVVAVIGAFLAHVGLLVDNMSTLRHKLHGNEAYPDGSWPSPPGRI